ncbi:hypothetical protein F2Q70_00012198 [Brassica cretica]|uniref:RNase H type-1 domain-containing protein n=1 Tax=Brassica cretica TaxID=69181 RepID=A0A8S9M1Q5_BRACR|nr:hypothetical protein F2Q70_00012198 [Brassica cretica]
MVFELKEISPTEILQSATSEAASWRLANVISTVMDENEGHQPLVHHSIPQRLCCRFDASWKDNNLRYGGGFVIENKDGNTIYGSFASNRVLSPLHTEFNALLWPMRSSLVLGYISMAFVSDCLQLVKLIEEEEEWPSLMAEFDDFIELRSKFICCSISFVPRSQNFRADRLAKGARSRGLCFPHVNSEVPTWIVLDTAWLESL